MTEVVSPVATLATVSASLAANIVDFRKAAVTAHNKATPYARSTLAAIASGVATIALVEVQVLQAFGNPKTPKGKAMSVSGLRDKSIVGGQAFYQAHKDVRFIAENIDSDANQPVLDSEGQPVLDSEGNALTIGEGAIRKAVEAFALGLEGAAKSLNELKTSVDASLVAFAALLMPDNGEAVADNEAAAPAAPAAAPAAPVSLATRIAELILAIGQASDDELNEAYDSFELINQAVNARIDAVADVTEGELEAA